MIASTLTRSMLRAASRAPVVRAAAVRPALSVSRVAVAPVRAFSLTPLARGQGESDSELSAKLAQELEYEQENSNLFVGDSPTNEPGFVTEFKQAGVWKINDQPGLDEVTLSREFGNEHISVVFSVGDIDTSEQPAMEGEEAAPIEVEDDEEGPQFPVRISVTITKPSGGALMIDAFVVDGEVNTDNIAFYKDQKLATTIDAEADFARRGTYLGPQFDTLDENLQSQFETFLGERGIDANLALFIPNYAEYKEQREYCDWLSHVRNFVEA
ncbi:mitochondrial glyco protein [Moesziomyces antarcticus]|uniref:Mitochondrial glyco protein n=2 Tax=Pseudozyma antarctica TaxID=84753 RepID=A0A081CLQ7_PSEA2|nr:mitochondrial glyco protein [Moesziomyces antarcticus]GAK67603.1 mitochondrial glyco protein [Moesziomyces antarcticus]SPO48871.1 probable Mrb1 - Mitochondrial p32 Family Protein [Moesziomyces antarcticus]